MKTMKKALLATMIMIGTALTVNAQQTTGDIAKEADVVPGTTTTGGAVRLIDNKGTIKFLQAQNGLTILSNTTDDVTTTTWQLGGTLSDNTYIDVDGNVFALNGLELVTDISTASTDADVDLDESDNDDDPAAGSTGFTVLIRDEDSGTIQKMRVSDLIQVQSGHTVFSNATTAAALGANTVTGLPEDYENVSVYRNGAKLIANDDYTVAADELTLVDKSGATPPFDWTLFPTLDVIEVHWVK